MANLGYVSSFNINGNELSLKDAALTEIVEEIIEAIGANNGDISDRINDLHNRAFDNVIEVEGDFIKDMRDSSFNSINDGLYKIKYVTTSGSGDNETKTLNNSAILIADGLTQYLYVNGRLFYCSKGSSTNAPWPPAWNERYVSNAGVTSVNGMTGAVTITHPVTSVNGQTGAVSITIPDVPVTSVNGQTGAINITIPTKTSDLTNDSNFTTLSEVQTEIVGAAPEQLNTLAELADALNDDQNFAATITNLIGQKYTKPSTGIPASDLANGVIPTVNDSTVTITMNGDTVGTFTLNKSGNTTIDLGIVLTSHQSIKTVNNESLVGTGNVAIQGLPTVTSADNGKVLMVVDGAWQLVSPVSLYSGSSVPSNSQGNNGDIYVQS